MHWDYTLYHVGNGLDETDNKHEQEDEPIPVPNSIGCKRKKTWEAFNTQLHGLIDPTNEESRTSQIKQKYGR